MEEKGFRSYWKEAYKTALPIVRSYEDAEDVAQQVCIKKIFYGKTIDNPLSWCHTVARNEALRIAREKKRFCDTEACFWEQLPFIEEDNVTTSEILNLKTEKEHPTDEQIFTTIDCREARQLLSKDDYQYYKLMIKHNLKPKKIAAEMGKSLDYVYDKNYRVKRNLAAAKYIKEGHREGKHIVSYNLHQNIICLQRKIIEYLGNGNNSAIKKHFLPDNYYEFTEIDINEFKDYSFSVIEKNRYSSVFFYDNSKGDINNFQIDFFINNNEKIIVEKLNILVHEIYLYEKQAFT